MPHVVIKIYPNLSDAEKSAMAEGVAEALHETIGYALGNVAVAVEEFDENHWMTHVYEPEIVGKQQQVVKFPAYGPLAHRAL